MTDNTDLGGIPLQVSARQPPVDTNAILNQPGGHMRSKRLRRAASNSKKTPANQAAQQARAALVKSWFDDIAAGRNPIPRAHDAVSQMLAKSARRWLDWDHTDLDDVVQEGLITLVTKVRSGTWDYRGLPEANGLLSSIEYFLVRSVWREARERARLASALEDQSDLGDPDPDADEREEGVRLAEATSRLTGRTLGEDDLLRLPSALPALFEMFPEPGISAPISIFLACGEYLDEAGPLERGRIGEAIHLRSSGAPGREVAARLGLNPATLRVSEKIARHIAEALNRWRRERRPFAAMAGGMLDPEVRDNKGQPVEINLPRVVVIWFQILRAAEIVTLAELVELGGMPRDVAEVFLQVVSNTEAGVTDALGLEYYLRRHEGQRAEEAQKRAGVKHVVANMYEATFDQWRKTKP